MLTHTQRTHNLTDLVLQSLDGFVIQMIPMVMRNNEVIYRRHIVCLVNLRSLERLIDKRNRGSRFKHRVDKQTLPVRLNKIGRMPEPNQHILIFRKSLQVRLHRFHFTLGANSLFFAEDEIPQSNKTILLARHQLRQTLVSERIISEIRRTFHPFQPLTRRQTTERRLIEKKQHPCGKKQHRTRNNQYSHALTFYHNPICLIKKTLPHTQDTPPHLTPCKNKNKKIFKHFAPSKKLIPQTRKPIAVR